jgi:hypothetical protein
MGLGLALGPTSYPEIWPKRAAVVKAGSSKFRLSPESINLKATGTVPITTKNTDQQTAEGMNT